MHLDLSKRYRISSAEEKEAEEEMHKEALERYRMSEVNNIFATYVVSDHSTGGFEDNDFADDGDNMLTQNDMYSQSLMMNDTMKIQPSFYYDNEITFHEEFRFSTSNKHTKGNVISSGGNIASHIMTPNSCIQ